MIIIVIVISFAVSAISSLLLMKYITETLAASWLHISVDSYRRAKGEYDAILKEGRRWGLLSVLHRLELEYKLCVWY